MNPVFRQASNAADGGLLMGLVTVAFFVFFAVVFFRMYRPGAKALYDAAAEIPLHDERPLSSPEVNHG